MFQRYMIFASVLSGLFILSSQVAMASVGYNEFVIAVYTDKNCSPKSKLLPVIEIDTNKKCSSYSYLDSKKKRFSGSQTNIRCYKDKVVMDKYPFSGHCSQSNLVSLNYVVKVNTCQAAPSHEGIVYEKMEDYVYPGSETCQIQSEQEFNADKPI